jgi:hypothetical protein
VSAKATCEADEFAAAATFVRNSDSVTGGRRDAGLECG